MVRLQIALHAFRAEHSAIERELLPRLEADDLVVADLQLNAALLSAEAAMRLYQTFRRIPRFILPATRWCVRSGAVQIVRAAISGATGA